MTIKDFKLEAHNLDGLNELLKMMLTNGAARVSAVKWQDKRKLNQNSLYWVWLKHISETCRPSDKKHDDQIWHEYFKRYFCPVKLVSMPAGDDLQVKSTKLLDVGEFCFYMNKIEQWAQGHMISLPIPDNCEYAQLNEKQNS